MSAGEQGGSHALKVLIVEDEVSLALEIEHIIGAEGHEFVGLACDSQNAAALAAREAPDLAVVDLRLIDGCTGPDVARSLTRRGVTVLIVTGEPSEAPSDLAGAVGLVVKPFTRKLMVEALRYTTSVRAGNAIASPPRFGFRLPQAQDPNERAARGPAPR